MSLAVGMGVGMAFGGNTGPSGPATFLGAIATGAQLARVTNGNTFCMMRTAHIAISDITAIMIIPTPGFDAANAPENTRGNNTTGTVTIGVEFSGVTTRMTFPAAAQSGGDPNTGLIPANGLNAGTDMVTLPTKITAGSTFFVRQFLNNNAGLFFIPAAMTGSSGKAAGTSGGVGGDLSQSTGAIPSENMTANGLAMPPCMIIGNTTKPSTAIFGDSKTYGFGSSTTVAGDGREGVICRSFPADTYAFVNLSHPGIQTTNYAAQCTATSALWPYFNRFIIDLGFNDVITNGASAATASASMTTLIALLPASAKKTITTLTPSSTSTDSWATAGNQTAVSNTSKEATYNALVRAGSITGVNNGFLEIGNALATGTDNGIWQTTGVANAITADGVHPTDAGYDLVKTNGGISDAILAAKLA